jgi:hypothetical protein
MSSPPPHSRQQTANPTMIMTLLPEDFIVAHTSIAIANAIRSVASKCGFTI